MLALTRSRSPLTRLPRAAALLTKHAQLHSSSTHSSPLLRYVAPSLAAGLLCYGLSSLNNYSTVEAAFYSTSADKSKLVHGVDVAAFANANKLVFYQYFTCPFCNKVRAFLDFYQLPYEVVEVTPLSKDEIKFSKEYKKVPILIVNGKQLNDSSVIISELDSLLDQYRAAPKVATEGEKKWLKFVDEKLIPLTTPNIYRTFGEALDSFNYIYEHSNAPAHTKAINKYLGGTVMYALTHLKTKKKYGIVHERQELYEAAKQWIGSHEGKAFHGGSQPDLSDVITFGVFRALKPYDALRADLMNPTNSSQQFINWFNSMDTMLGKGTGTAINAPASPLAAAVKSA